MKAHPDSLAARGTLETGVHSSQILRLDAPQERLDVAPLPFSPNLRRLSGRR